MSNRSVEKINRKISRGVLFGLLLVMAGLLASCGGKKETGNIFIAAGAGYKKPVMEICESFTEETGIAVSPIFGNMQQVAEQVKQSGRVGVLIGDKAFLENPSLGISYTAYIAIGAGRLVLAYPAGAEKVGPEDLTSPRIQRLAIPDTQKAIYGRAAMKYLQNRGLWDRLQDKILIGSTVPQVSSYLVSGEVDVGFINLTDAIGIADKIGGYQIITENVPSLEIVAGQVTGFEKDKNLRAFTDYLTKEASRRIMEKYGL